MNSLEARFKKVAQLYIWTIAFYSLIRLCFLIWNWNQYHENPVGDLLLCFFYGIRFDWTGVSALFIPIWILQLFYTPGSWDRLRRWYLFLIYIAILLPFFIMDFGDIDYINFSGRRFTKFGMNMLGEAKGKMGGFLSTHGIPMIIVALLIGLMLRKAYKICFSFSAPEKQHLKQSPAIRWSCKIAIGFLALVFLIIGGRGGLQAKPIDFVSASFLPSSRMHNLTLNSTFTFLKSLDRNDLPLASLNLTEAEVKTALIDIQSVPSLLEGHRLPAPQNVVLIVVESLSYEYMGFVNPKNTFTPFLDELAKKSLVFHNGFANARRSIDGLPALLSGIPAMMDESFITSEFITIPLPSIASLVKKKGYHTSFFHGGNNGTLYLDSYTKGAGFDLFFGAKEYPDPKDNDGFWGIFDEPFLQFFAQKLATFPQPFFTGVFTLSSHHPYVVPEKYKDKFAKGPLEISESMRYTDFALKEFFETAQTMPWYKNTLFVITADHTHKNLLPEFDNEWGRYRIPFLFFHPQMAWPQIDGTQVVQQLDFIPSVLDFLQIPEEKTHHLSASVFKPFDRAVYFYNDNKYFMIMKDQTVTLNTDSAVRVFGATDKNYATPVDVPPEKKAQLGLRIKAAVQNYADYLNVH